MAIIMGTYYGFMGPSFINYFFNYDPSVKRYLVHILEGVFYFNAILNPFIYAWMNKDFNQAFRKILRIKSEANGNKRFVIGTRTDFSTKSMDLHSSNP